MKRIMSDMTGAELVDWQQRCRITVQQAADLLGISRRQYQRSIASNHVPLQTAIIVQLRDQLDDYDGIVTAGDLADIAAGTTKSS